MSDATAQGELVQSAALTRGWRVEATRHRGDSPLGPMLFPGGTTRSATVRSESEAFALLPLGRRRELLEFVASELIRNAARVSSSIVCTVTRQGDWIVIDVVDRAGANTLSALEAAISRAREERRAVPATFERAADGAGLGLYLIERRSAFLSVCVSLGHFTRVTATLWLGIASECVVEAGAETAYILER